MNNSIQKPKIMPNEFEKARKVKEYEVQKTAFNNPKHFDALTLNSRLIAVVAPAINPFTQGGLAKGELEMEREYQDAFTKAMPVITTGIITDKKPNSDEPFLKSLEYAMLDRSSQPIKQLYYKGVRILIYDVNSVVAVVSKDTNDNVFSEFKHKLEDNLN